MIFDMMVPSSFTFAFNANKVGLCGQTQGRIELEATRFGESYGRTDRNTARKRNITFPELMILSQNNFLGASHVNQWSQKLSLLLVNTGMFGINILVLCKNSKAIIRSPLSTGTSQTVVYHYSMSLDTSKIQFLVSTRQGPSFSSLLRTCG